MRNNIILITYGISIDRSAADFTPVCTTEMAAMAGYAQEFEKRGVKLLGISCDDVASHKEWIKDIEAFMPGAKLTYPIMADPDRRAIKELNMVDPDEKDARGVSLPSRTLHIVGPDKAVKLSFLYRRARGGTWTRCSAPSTRC